MRYTDLKHEQQLAKETLNETNRLSRLVGPAGMYKPNGQGEMRQKEILFTGPQFEAVRAILNQ